MAVIDASVYVALINADEAEHAACWAWFERVRARGEAIAAPAILLAEVAAALSRGVGDPEMAHRIVDQLERSAVIELVPVTVGLAGRAARVAADFRIRGCDALYVALADQLGESLITLDGQQLERATAIVDARAP